MFAAFESKVPGPPMVIIEPSLRHDIDEIISKLWPKQKLAVVDDQNTSAAAGEKIFKALSSHFDCLHVTFPAAAIATDEAARWLEQETKGDDALVAVGSGSINDLCKYVSHKAGKPYLVIPTAASMNGYVSANASIKVQGYKTTLPGQMPQAVLCDMGVIAAAPARLNKSGMGDSLARPTAQADWLLSHLLLGTPYDDTLYDPLLDIENELFASARGVAKADKESLTLLMKNLLLSGMGMTAAGGSYPASQGEHMIAHAYGMMKLTHPLPLTFHGEEVGVATLTMARLQEDLLQKKAVIRKENFHEQEIKKLFGGKVAKEAKIAFAEKTAQVESLTAKDKDWQSIAGEIESIMVAPVELQRVLKELDAPTTPEALGWKPTHYATATGLARYLRNRFTFLDLQ